MPDFTTRKACMLTVVFSLSCIGAPTEAASGPIPIKERITEAMAASRLCPNLRVNRRVFERVARKVGMDPTPGSKDMSALEQRVQRQVPRLLRFERWIICDLGKYNFGPDGATIKGLLKTR